MQWWCWQGEVREGPHLHGAEFGATHGAEVGGLGRLLGQRGVVKEASGHRVQRQVELVIPGLHTSAVISCCPRTKDDREGTAVVLYYTHVTKQPHEGTQRSVPETQRYGGGGSQLTI